MCSSLISIAYFVIGFILMNCIAIICYIKNYEVRSAVDDFANDVKNNACDIDFYMIFVGILLIFILAVNLWPVFIIGVSCMIILKYLFMKIYPMLHKLAETVDKINDEERE